MKRDDTEKILSELARKVGRSIRSEAASVKKLLLARYREEMTHAKSDAKTIIARKSSGKA